MKVGGLRFAGVVASGSLTAALAHALNIAFGMTWRSCGR